MSLNSVNKNSTSSYIPNFNTVPAAPAAPQQPVEDKQKSNAYKYMIGATALAGLAALAIAGYKGHLGEGIQKFLGGAEKEAASIKPKPSDTPNLESVVTPKTETAVTPNSETIVSQKTENVISEQIETSTQEEAGAIVAKPAEVTEEASNIVKKETEEAGEAISTEKAKVVRAAEIVPAKLGELVPPEMITYLKMSEEELEKFPRLKPYSSDRVVEAYSDGKPKYVVDPIINTVQMLDKETGNCIKYLSKNACWEYDPKIPTRELKGIGIKDGQISYIYHDISWNEENKILQKMWYELDGKTPKYLQENIYDPETKVRVKTIGYRGTDKSSGISYVSNYDRITGERID